MRTSTHFFFSFFTIFLIISFLNPLSLVVHASTTVDFDASKASRCVTSATIATNKQMLAKMEKDIAPYKQKAKASLAIRAYQESLSLAWEAMKQPYCGYGSPGASSAKKSYLKTTTRARNTFLQTIRNLDTSITSGSAKITPIGTLPVTSTADVPSISIKTVPTTKIVKPLSPTTKPSKRITIPSGLVRGMRSEDVTDLQRLLLNHFHQDISDATPYFGTKTEVLVIRFQIEQGIIPSRYSPGAGQVGPKTATALNQLP